MKPPLRLCLGDELPSTDPRQCHGAMILPLRAVIYGVAPVAFPRHAGGAHTGHNGK